MDEPTTTSELLSDASATPAPGRGFWIVSGVALAWNLVGVGAYLSHVMLSPEDLAAMDDAVRELYTGAPAWVTGAYAVAVFGGALGCAGLLLRKAWSLPVFVVSLVGILAQFGYTLLAQNTVEVMGASVLVMPAVIIAIGLYLVWFARAQKAAGILA